MPNRKILVLMIVGLLLIGTAGASYGENLPAAQQGSPQAHQRMNAEFQKALDELIAVKVITVEQKNQITEYCEKAFKDHGDADPKAMGDPQKRRTELIDSLIKDGVINQDQGAVVARVLPKPMFRWRSNRRIHPQTPPDPEQIKTTFQSKLDSLVNSKVITDKQKGIIFQYFNDHFEKMKGQKPGTRGRNMPDARANYLNMLVKCGIISQKQANTIAAIDKAMPGPMMRRGFRPHHPQSPPDPEKMKAGLQKRLDELAASKVITNEQATAVSKYLNDTIDEMKERKGPLSPLVKDGVITQEQADAIMRALFTPPAHKDGERAPEQPQQ
jgi:hypothetical protein